MKSENRKTEWKPFEDAPKDGTPIIVFEEFGDGSYQVETTAWHEMQQYWIGFYPIKIENCFFIKIPLS